MLRVLLYELIKDLPDFEDLSNFIKDNRFNHIPLKTAE